MSLWYSASAIHILWIFRCWRIHEKCFLELVLSALRLRDKVKQLVIRKVLKSLAKLFQFQYFMTEIVIHVTAQN